MRLPEVSRILLEKGVGGIFDPKVKLTWWHIKPNVQSIGNTLKKNRNATLFQWKIDGVAFKVLDRNNEPSSFQDAVAFKVLDRSNEPSSFQEMPRN